jgi:hypothetical protein
MTHTELIQTFQFAILDLSAKLETDRNTMTPEDIEKTNYVVSMAAVNAFNLEQVMKRGDAYYWANKEKVDRLIETVTGFAEALKQEGVYNFK